MEANLRALARVRDAVVIPVLKDGAPDSLAAFVVLDDATAAEAPAEITRSLRAELQERLPGYMLPRRLELLDSLPTNPNGKIDRRRLGEMLR